MIFQAVCDILLSKCGVTSVKTISTAACRSSLLVQSWALNFPYRNPPHTSLSGMVKSGLNGDYGNGEEEAFFAWPVHSHGK